MSTPQKRFRVRMRMRAAVLGGRIRRDAGESSIVW